MENENVLDTNLSSGLVVNETAKRAFDETGSWSKFFAILGFIGAGLMVILALFMMFAMGSLMGSAGLSGGMGIGAGILYLVLAALYIMPCLYLWRFATKVKTSISTNNQEEFTDAIVNLKSCYKFFGIMTVIMLAFYLIILIGGLAMSAF